MKQCQVIAEYDDYGDVLYLTLGEPVPSHVKTGHDGLLFRVSHSNAPSGAMVMGLASNGWLRDDSSLNSEIANFLGVSPEDVARAVQYAVAHPAN